MPTATLLSAYKNKPRVYSLIFGKSKITFESGVPKDVSPSVAAILKNKTEIVRDSKGKKTGKTRCMFDIKDMPEIRKDTSSARSQKDMEPATGGKSARNVSRGQRRIA